VAAGAVAEAGCEVAGGDRGQAETGCAAGLMILEGKQSLLFLKKKKQKNFLYCGRWHARATARSKQKFFASFFQKRSAFF
jgi:hypothetical protein